MDLSVDIAMKLFAIASSGEISEVSFVHQGSKYTCRMLDDNKLMVVSEVVPAQDFTLTISSVGSVGVKEGDWIKSTERLPENGECCLVCYWDENLIRHMFPSTFTLSGAEACWKDWGKRIIPGKTVFWMPLEIPKLEV